MTTPVTPVEPKTAKTWVALIGSALAVVVPLLLQVSEWLPQPYPAIIGGAIGLLTALGVYRAPYKPTGTVLVPGPTPQNPDTYQNPWK